MFRGALAGAIATAVMSVLMLCAKRAGIMGSMPPEKITSTLLNRTGMGRSSKQQDAVAAALHFAVGVGGGAAFEVARKRVPLAPVPLGIAYGTGIWAVSYMGWVPALGVMPPAHRDRLGRQSAMLVGHLAYGGTLGILSGHR